MKLEPLMKSHNFLKLIVFIATEEIDRVDFTCDVNGSGSNFKGKNNKNIRKREQNVFKIVIFIYVTFLKLLQLLWI